MADFRKHHPAACWESPRRGHQVFYDRKAILTGLGLSQSGAAAAPTQPLVPKQQADELRRSAVVDILKSNPRMKVSAIQSELRKRIGSGMRKQMLVKILAELRIDGTYHPLPNHRPSKKVVPGQK
jgi:hypothetical protein